MESTAGLPASSMCNTLVQPYDPHLSMSSTTLFRLAVNFCSICSTSLLTSFLCSSSGLVCGQSLRVVVIQMQE